MQIIAGVQAISAGAEHSLFLKTDGTVWATGFNYDGRLGGSTWTLHTSPVEVMSGVQAIAAGLSHSLFIKRGGAVWATGSNSDGRLGDGTTDVPASPVPVMSDVQAISAGGVHSLFVKTDGTFWATGDNSYGQLGDDTTTQRLSPVPVLFLVNDPGLVWQQEQFGLDADNPLTAGWYADPDHDGLANLLERAFNLNPNQPGLPVLVANTGSSGLPSITATGSGAGLHLKIEYIRRKAANNPGLIYTPQLASDLGAPWQDFTGSETVESIDTEWERVTVEDITSGQPMRFGRVKVVSGE